MREVSSNQAGLLVLLLLLYTTFALPVGLIFGSIPFILKEHASFTSLSVFSLTTLPYAFKLLFAPVIDSITISLSPCIFLSRMFKVSRRPSWIIPSLCAISVLMYGFSARIQRWTMHGSVVYLTPFFVAIISLVAVGEIAIDGWSVELLSSEYRTYASVCQAIGPSIGYTLTFTLFLPLNNPKFAQKFLHWAVDAGPVLTLAGVSKITGIASLAVMLFVLCVDAFVLNGIDDGNTSETGIGNRNTSNIHSGESDDELVALTSESEIQPQNGRTNRYRNINSTSKAYEIFGRILRLKHIQRLVVVLLVCKWGFSSFDSAAPLKLIEDGFPKESIASIAVIQSVTQLLGTVLVGRYLNFREQKSSAGILDGGNMVNIYPYINLFLFGYFFRFLFSLSGPIIVYAFKNQMKGAMTMGFFAVCTTIMTIYGIFSYCCMFVPLAAYFLHITSSSTVIAGSYLTLLHTAYNIGSYWPKIITLGLIDKLTVFRSPHCTISPGCPVRISGYYIVSLIEAVYTVLAGLLIYRQMRKFEKLPLESWSVPEIELELTRSPSDELQQLQLQSQ